MGCWSWVWKWDVWTSRSFLHQRGRRWHSGKDVCCWNGLWPPTSMSSLTFRNLEFYRGSPTRVAIRETPVEAGILGGELVEDDSVGAIAWLIKQRQSALVPFIHCPVAFHEHGATPVSICFPATPGLEAAAVLGVVGTGDGHGASCHTFHHSASSGHCRLWKDRWNSVNGQKHPNNLGCPRQLFFP